MEWRLAVASSRMNTFRFARDNLPHTFQIAQSCRRMRVHCGSAFNRIARQVGRRRVKQTKSARPPAALGVDVGAKAANAEKSSIGRFSPAYRRRVRVTAATGSLIIALISGCRANSLRTGLHCLSECLWISSTGSLRSREYSRRQLSTSASFHTHIPGRSQLARRSNAASHPRSPTRLFCRMRSMAAVSPL